MLNFLAAAIGTTWELPFEIPYIEWLQSIAGKGSLLYYLMNFISMFGEELVLVGILGFIYWGLSKERGEKVGLFLITANLLTPLVKNIACRTRPFDSHPYIEGQGGVQNLRDVNGYSFPSGHSSGSSSVLFGTAMAYKDKKQKWLWAVCCIIPVLVAFSRNYLGAHYPTDVVAGLALGVGTVFLMNWLISVVHNKYFVYGGILLVGLAGFFYCTTEDFYTAYGIALGFTFGILFEEKITHFTNTKVWWRLLLRVAVGGALFMGLNSGIKGVVGAFGSKYCLECNTAMKLCLDPQNHKGVAWFLSPDHVWFERIFRTLRYGVVVFVMIGVYPLLFAPMEKLWRKWGWLQTDDTITGKIKATAESTTTVAEDQSASAEQEAVASAEATDNAPAEGSEE